MKEYTTRELQEVILSIMKDVDVFCRENDITYYLMSGSALGAMRHQGFIPWDDDMDLFMTYDQYMKFLRLFDRKAPRDPRFKKYFLQRENTSAWPLYMSRVCLNGTTVIGNEFRNNMKQHHNVFVDIFCLYSIPKAELPRRLQYTAAILLRVNTLYRSGFPTKNKWKKLALEASGWLINPLVRSLLIRYVRRYEGKDTALVGNYFGRARYHKTAFPRAWLGDKPRYVPFEDTQLPVFERAEDYLEMRFGDKWMEIPSQAVRDQYPSHSDFVDLEKDYTEYMSPDRKSWLI